MAAPNRGPGGARPESAPAPVQAAVSASARGSIGGGDRASIGGGGGDRGSIGAGASARRTASGAGARRRRRAATAAAGGGVRRDRRQRRAAQRRRGNGPGGAEAAGRAARLDRPVWHPMGAATPEARAFENIAVRQEFICEFLRSLVTSYSPLINWLK